MPPPRYRRALSRAGVVLLLCAAAGACGEGGEGGEEPADVAAKRGGTAVVGVSGPAGTILPPLVRTALDGQLSGILYEGLNVARWESGGLAFPEGHPRGLADRWRFHDDSTRLTYHLRPGTRWSDGTALTASDVAFTYRLLADRRAGLPLSYVTGHLDSLTVHGDTAVTFHFARRYPGMLFDTGVGILPEHVFGRIPPAEFGDRAPSLVAESLSDGEAVSGEANGGNGERWSPRTGPAVSGPFRIASWKRGERVVLVRNRASHTPPRLDTLVLRVLPEETTRLAELRTGGLDLADVTSFREAARLEARPGFRVLRQPRRAYDYVAWNPGGHPAFADPRVREALSLAIDREQILRALDMEAYAVPAAGPYGPLFPRLRVEAEGPLHDPERAARLLDRAGWTRSGDGVRTREGRRLRFELATQAGNDRRTAAVELIQAQLGRVGVRAEVRTQEFNSLFARMRSSRYEAALLGWQVGLDPDISPFWYDPASPVNVVGYGDARVRAMMDSARAAPTSERAAPYWSRAAAAVAADHPYAFLWHFDLPWAAASRLRGVEVDAASVTGNVHEWWIADRPP